jgi:hypothetical protein
MIFLSKIEYIICIFLYILTFKLGLHNISTECIFYAYDKIKNKLLEKYNITVDDLMVKDCKSYIKESDIQPTGFSFYLLTHDTIQEFNEDNIKKKQ